MNSKTAVIGNIAFLVFFLFGVPLIGLGVTMYNFGQDCAATSGHTVTEGFTTWCRH